MMTDHRSTIATPMFQIISMNNITEMSRLHHVGGQVVGVAMNKMNVCNLLSRE